MTNPMALRPISKTKAYEQAADAIKARILDGTWSPGDRIPSERELADQLAISRGSTREALRILEAMGWLEIRPGEGTIVKDRGVEVDLDPASEKLLRQQVKFGEIWESRKIVEPEIAYLAAERCDQTELDVIEGALSRMIALADAGQMEGALLVNTDFHLGVAKASGNMILAHFQRILADAEIQGLRGMESTDRRDTSPERVAKTIREHRAILDAIRTGKPKEAERAMFEHLVDSWMARWYLGPKSRS
jgi:GntR family transcriptional regulator, transcriptional repressor for pyruvate dehydrogenase complex